MSDYSVTVLKMGEAEVPGPEVFWMSRWEAWQTLYFYMVVIRGAGVIAIINTGPPHDLTMLNERWQAFAGERCRLVRSEHDRPYNALQTLGIQPEDVTHVLITPLQLYATANIPLFRHADICISRRGWIEDIMARPPWLHVPRELCISDDVLKYMLFDARDR